MAAAEAGAKQTNLNQDTNKEKAGIIKNKIPIITNAKGKALNVIKQVAKKKNAKLIIPKAQKFQLKLKGNYQQENAQTAYTALQQLNIPKNQILKGLKNPYWPARFEKFNNIIIESAHNIAGMKNLVKQLKNKKLITIVSIMKDKDIKEMTDELKKLNSKFIITKASISRAEDPEILAQFFTSSIIIRDPKQAIYYAKAIRKNETILITGSIYLMGDIYSRSLLIR